MAKKKITSLRYISIGPVGNLTFIPSEKIISFKTVKSKDIEKPYCLNIDLDGLKSKLIYFATESDLEKDLRKIHVERAKVQIVNDFK